MTGRRWKIFRPFVQDDWRVSKDLTLNLGLAWAMATPISEVASRQADFIPANGQFLIPGVNYVGISAGIRMDWMAFEPRIGFAYKLFGSDKTVLRAGYAIYPRFRLEPGCPGSMAESAFRRGIIRLSFGGLHFTGRLSAYAGAVQLVGPGALSSLRTDSRSSLHRRTRQPLREQLLTQKFNLNQGMMQQFNVNVERQLPGNVVLTAGMPARAPHTS